jgi:hypothetical protein
MWNAFKRGFLKAFLPAITRINDIFAGIRTEDVVKFGRTIGSVLGNFVTIGGQLLAIVFPLTKMLTSFLKTFGLFGRIIGGVLGKILVPVGIVLTVLDRISIFVKNLSKA